MNPETLSTLLVAQTEHEVDEAFKLVYELLQDANFSEYDELLQWATKPEIVSSLHTDLILALLRLPYPIRGKLPSWDPMLDAAHEEFLKREEPGCVERLLWGLLG